MRLAPRIYGGFHNAVTGQDKVEKCIKRGRMIGVKQMAKFMQYHKFNILQRQAHKAGGKHNACVPALRGNFAGTKTALAGTEIQLRARLVIRSFYGMLQTKAGCFFLKNLPQGLIIKG